MFPLPLDVLKYIKIIGYSAVLGLFAYLIWDVTSTYAQNKTLKLEVIAKEASIVTLQSDVKVQKDLNVALLARKQLVDTVYRDRIVYVDRVKKSDEVYIENTKSEIEKAKITTPNSLDQIYYSRYNGILKCIENVTDGKDELCDIH